MTMIQQKACSIFFARVALVFGFALSTQSLCLGSNVPSISIVAENASSTNPTPLTECMEGRTVTFTATATGFTTSTFYPMTFTFNYTRANGTTWTSSDTSWDFVEDNDAEADQVANAPAPANTNHYFNTPVFVTGTDSYGGFATSSTLSIRVWRLWIVNFDGGKPWKVVVGSPITYAATASSDCASWEWDMQDGASDAWNPTGGNAKTGSSMVIPNADKARASNSWFGDTYGTVDVFCEDGDGNNHHFYSTSMSPSTKAKVFFDKDTNVNGTAPSTASPAAWYVFWAGTAVTEYDSSNTYSYANGATGDFAVYDGIPNNPHYTLHGPGSASHEVYHTTKGTLDLNVDRTGIDTCTCTVVHEKQHRTTDLDWLAGGAWNGKADADGDELPDDWEKQAVRVAQGFDYLTASSFSSNFPYGDDEEVWCEINAYGKTGDATKDWSKDGKQW